MSKWHKQAHDICRGASSSGTITREGINLLRRSFNLLGDATQLTVRAIDKAIIQGAIKIIEEGPAYPQRPEAYKNYYVLSSALLNRQSDDYEPVRFAHRIHDEQTATALVLQAGAARIAIVALDILTINEFIVDRIPARLAPAEGLLCCSHTHSGPIAYADEKSPRRNQEYTAMLVDRVVETVKEAEANLQPAWLEYSSGEAQVGINRREKQPDGRMEIGRNPQGPRDRSVQAVSIFKENPRPAGEEQA